MINTTLIGHKSYPVIFRFVSILSTPLATYLIISVAILSRIIQLIFFYNIRVDASYQVMATEHFLNGHGISLGYVNPADLSETIYKPLVNWPPGYSLLLSPFYFLSGYNYIAAGITLDIIMAVILIIACRLILKRLHCSAAMQNLCTLINGFFIYYFYFIASSDAIAISVFSLIIYFTIKLFQQEGKNKSSLRWIVILSLIVGLIKYLFIPVVFVIPLYLLIVGWRSRQKSICNAGLISFAVLFILNAGFLLYQISISGQAGYISSSGRGFFTEHLLNIYPFVIASFINPDTLTILANQDTGSNTLFYKMLQLLNTACVLYITACFFYFISKKKTDKIFSVNQNFYLLAFHLSVVVFHVLVILSLQVAKEEILPGYFWTYVEEPRYYGLVVVLFHMGIFIFYRHLYKVSAVSRALFYVFCIFLLLETSRGVYLTLNRVKNISVEEYSWQYEDRFQKAVGTVIEEVKAAYPQTSVIVTGSSYYYNHRVSLYSHVPILYDFSTFIGQQPPITTNPVVVVSVVTSSDVLESKIERDKIGKWQGEFEKFSIYTRYVPAN